MDLDQLFSQFQDILIQKEAANTASLPAKDDDEVETKLDVQPMRNLGVVRVEKEEVSLHTDCEENQEEESIVGSEASSETDQLRWQVTVKTRGDESDPGFTDKISRGSIRQIANILNQSPVPAEDEILAKDGAFYELRISPLHLIAVQPQLEALIQKPTTSNDLRSYVKGLLSLALEPPEKCILSQDDYQTAVARSTLSLRQRRKAYITDGQYRSHDGFSVQKDIIRQGRVLFKDLPNLFLPGDLIYTEDPTPHPGVSYEQCWLVKSCDFTPSETFLVLKASEWVWKPPMRRFVMRSMTLLEIDRYDGEREITVTSLGAMPLKSFTASNQEHVRQRLISRARSYTQMTLKSIGVWQYTGPAASPSHFHQNSMWNACPHSGTASRAYSWGLSFSGKLILENFHPGMYPIEPGYEDQVLEASDQIADECYLIMSGYALAKTLPSLKEIRIDIKHLTEPLWQEMTSSVLDDVCRRVSTQARAKIQEFETPGLSRCLQTRSRAGAIFAVDSRSIDCMSMIEGVAEMSKRGLVSIDLLDIAGNDGSMFTTLEANLLLAMRVNAIVRLQNFGPLVTKRSYDDLQRCKQVTMFIETLASFTGVAFLCLDQEDIVDPLFEQMKPIEI